MQKEYRLTQEGVDELKQELEECKARVPIVAEQIKVAREQGDLTENAEYQVAKEEQQKIQHRIHELENVLKNVEIIDGSNNSKDEVNLGSQVVLLSDDGNEMNFHIVGSLEADPLENKISDESPIGSALLGTKKGKEVAIKLPAGEKTFKVKDIK